MVQTKKRHTDDTLVLEPGDHPFIRHSSAVQYSTANKFRIRNCQLQADMDAALLQKVRQGLLDSPFTIHVIKDLCDKLWKSQLPPTAP